MDIWTEIDRRLWQTEIGSKPWYARGVYLFSRLLIAIVRDIQDGSLSLRATSLVYTTLLSLAPLLALCFSVMKGFGATAQLEPFLKDILGPLGDQSGEVSSRLAQFVNNVNVSVLGAIGLGLLVFSVLSLMQKIESAFNAIWNVSSSRPFLQRVRDYFAALLIGPLFIFLAVAMTAAVEHESFAARWLDFAVVSTTLQYVFLLMPFILFTLAFTAIYMFIPNTRVLFAPAYIAAVITTVLWKVLGWAFATFVAGSGNYAAIYSAFAALVLFIIWLYMGWLLLLVGASISYYLQNPTNQRLSRRFRLMSSRIRFKLALMVAAATGRAFYEKIAPPDLTTLARQLRVPARAVEQVVQPLLANHILAQNGEGYIPGLPYEETSAYTVLAAIASADESEGVSYEGLRKEDTVDHAVEMADSAAAAALSKLTLKQLSLGEDI